MPISGQSIHQTSSANVHSQPEVQEALEVPHRLPMRPISSIVKPTSLTEGDPLQNLSGASLTLLIRTTISLRMSLIGTLSFNREIKSLLLSTTCGLFVYYCTSTADSSMERSTNVTLRHYSLVSFMQSCGH